MSEDRARYRYRTGEYAPGDDDTDITRVAWRDPHELADLLGDVDADTRGIEREARLQAGIDQIAGAMMDAEDRAEATPGVPVVDVYRTDDTMLRVAVTVDDENGGFAEADLRDANRPFIPVSWRKGSGTVSNLYPVEVRDQTGNLIGAWAAGQLQITYHFAEPESPFVKGYKVQHEGFDYNWPCRLCGRPINTEGHEVVSADDWPDSSLIVRCPQ